MMENSKEIDLYFSGTAGRLDAWLAETLVELTRTRIKGLFRDGHVRVNEKTVKPSYKPHINDKIHVFVPPTEKPDIAPWDAHIDIIYEDKDIVVVNKPSGMPTHISKGHYTDTLVNILMAKVKDLSGIGGLERPGIVHRLDKDTSGVLVVAKNGPAHHHLSAQFKDKTTRKRYIAVTKGIIRQNHMIINGPIGRSRLNRKKFIVRPDGKDARTDIQVLKRYARNTLIKIRLHTGRTHQIRVHLSSINFPLVGDDLYGRNRDTVRLMLHAASLKITHPQTGQRMRFRAAIPLEIREYLNTCEHPTPL